MNKRTKFILSVCMVILLTIGAGGHAYVSGHYHADKAALTAMAH